MFIILNDGRKVNMLWVISFYQDKSEVVFDMAKGTAQQVRESFNTNEEAATRVEELEKEFLN